MMPISETAFACRVRRRQSWQFALWLMDKMLVTNQRKEFSLLYRMPFSTHRIDKSVSARSAPDTICDSAIPLLQVSLRYGKLRYYANVTLWQLLHYRYFMHVAVTVYVPITSPT